MDQGLGTAWSTRKSTNATSQMRGSSHGAHVPCLLLAGLWRQPKRAVALLDRAARRACSAGRPASLLPGKVEHMHFAFYTHTALFNFA